MEEEAEKMKEEDKKTQKFIKLKNKSESLIFATEDLIADHREKLPKEVVEDIEAMSTKL
jgi:molecular chaperone DnaK (HSP70)